MTQSTLTIWTNAKFPDEVLAALAANVAPHRLIYAAEANRSNLAAAPVDPRLPAADIAFGQPDAEQAMRLDNLKWIHLTSAGYTTYDRVDFKNALSARGAMLTTSSSVYDDPCAQHALAMMMAFARRLPESLKTQFGDRAWNWTQRRRESFLLNSQTALLFGFGAIAVRLCELLAPFRMNLIGVRRTVKGDEPVRIITGEQVEEFLPRADHVINLLPGNQSTMRYFGEDRFGQMKPGAIFYNIGRGSSVDQEALLAALERGNLAGAYLDVTTPEPLPPDHPLWSAPNCFITPHSAGGQIREHHELVGHFLENLRRFAGGRELLDRIV
ncbi:MAG TPA: D-2-hydroxyacid dehydrogenase [Blastocatellia bacterium]|jgi:phosphoglycerate dehydrogenase-like enzyme|nr:D-2-hydroxyacid dehydrogenase [Blastocatellia bacterium]